MVIIPRFVREVYGITLILKASVQPVTGSMKVTSGQRYRLAFRGILAMKKIRNDLSYGRMLFVGGD